MNVKIYYFKCQQYKTLMIYTRDIKKIIRRADQQMKTVEEWIDSIHPLLKNLILSGNIFSINYETKKNISDFDEGFKKLDISVVETKNCIILNKKRKNYEY